MPDPVGVNRPPVYRPAATQPLDPAVAERVTQQLKSTLAKTTPLDPAEQEMKLPGLLGAVQDFVSSIFGGSKAASTTAAPAATVEPQTIALPQSGQEGRLPDAEPTSSASAAMRDWSSMVSMDGAGPAAAPGTSPATALPPDSRPGTRSWGMVSMDGAKAEEPTADSRSAPPGMFRSWGMVSMADAPEVKSEPAEDTPQVFRSWGMVDLKEPPAPPKAEPPKVEPPKVEPPRAEPPRAEPPKVEPPKVEPPKAEPPKVEPPKAEPPGAPDPLRAAKLEQLSKLVGPEVRPLLAKLDQEGKLDAKGPSGVTVLDSLLKMGTTRLGETALSLGYTNKSVVERTIKDIADPLSIQQQGDNDCVWTNLRFALSNDSPGEYAELAADLYTMGEAQLKGGGKVKLEDALKPFDLGGSVGKLWYKDGELWMQYKGFPQMPADDFVTQFLNNNEWIDSMLAKNPLFDNPLIRGLIDSVKAKWNEGKKEEVLQLIAPFVDLFIQVKGADGGKVEGLKYAMDNFRSLFQPATQASGALPKGVALGAIDEFYPGLKGYYVDDTVIGYLDQAAQRGARVPVAFTTDDGQGLHMASILGKWSDTEYIVYDPENGARSMPAEVLKERAVGAFLPDGMGQGLTAIPDSDDRAVGGGRFGWKAVRG